MSDDTLDTLVGFFKALAETSRLRIVGLLAQRERSVEELAVLLDLKAPTVSHHLKTLRSLSLVVVRQEGTSRLYSLNESAFNLLKKEVLETVAAHEAKDGDSVDPFEQKVLKSFLIDGRLTAIPAQRKKRRVILRYLLERFEWDRDYPESEVNEIIRELHPDVATLRREMICEHLMTRDRGIYRRCPTSEASSS